MEQEQEKEQEQEQEQEQGCKEKKGANDNLHVLLSPRYVRGFYCIQLDEVPANMENFTKKKPYHLDFNPNQHLRPLLFSGLLEAYL